MRLRITVEGVSYDVEVEILDEGDEGPAAPPRRSVSSPARPAAPSPQAPPAPPAPPPPAAGGEEVCRSPIAGTVLEVRVQPGQEVALNEVLMVLEAMKMEANIASPVAGTVQTVHVGPGEAVRQGQLLVEFA